MTFLRGASLTTSASLGYADAADLGPTAGNGFRSRWPDDLAALQDVGITDVQITLDWARLQPKPNEIDADWAEWFEQILRAAAAIDVRPWACLHDGSIPRWFDNEGGLDDDEALTLWWPRWVERAADRFGDIVGGWVPFAHIPSGSPEQPWIDTWGVLSGGPPVVASVDLRSDADSVARFAERTDLLGAVLSADWGDAVDGATIAGAAERWGNELRDAADGIDNHLAIAGFSSGHSDPEVAGEIVQAWRSMLDAAVGDGVHIDVAFVEPAIAGPDSPIGLLDSDRAPTPSSNAFLVG